MCEPNLVFRMVKPIVKTQSEVVFNTLSVPIVRLHPLVIVQVNSKLCGVDVVPRYFILEVVNVGTCSLPKLAMLRGHDFTVPAGVGFHEFLK